MADQTEREEALFQAALQLEKPEERTAYLAGACGGDEVLRRRVSVLLRAHEQAGEFLARPVPGLQGAEEKASRPGTTIKMEAAPVVSEKPGDRIGRYKLLQKIGEGGCGVVYMAEQEEPMRRRVALKIIKVGMDTRQVIARFEAERQALAMMDHPNIARALDAGATETGRPYFVMDLVRGIRITEYCDQSKLSTEERLRLFIQVCHAIQHAHQKGVIHRDIKPSNILVTLHDGVPVPVIIDFGIAKATEQRLTDKTLFTAFEQFIGTPAYMSPEQAEMSRLDVDTRTDIYSLGVLLYELLTGRTPFDPKTLLQGGLDQMRRTIREKDPLRPSTCLSGLGQADLTTVADQRRAEPLRLISLLHGDLDWIVMKCLEKDRTRRYETANGLALDIERYLSNQPVLARPPSKLYLLQKMVRRNRVAVGAGVVIVAVLVAGMAVSTHLFLLERKAYRRAVLAERNQSRLRTQAEEAQALAVEERRTSEDNARRSRLNAYAADVYSASLALQSGNLGRAMDLLERQTPQVGQEDLRGFEWRYLWQQARGEELLSLPHDGLVSCAVFSPDGQRLATACYDGQVRIWDLPTKRVRKTISGFERQFGWRYLAYSPDGHWLAGVRHGTLTVWDATRDDWPVQFEDTTTGFCVVAFAPVGSRLVAWGANGLFVFDTNTWQRVTMRSRLRPASFPCLAIDQSGKLAAVAHEKDPEVEIWNLDFQTLAGSFKGDVPSDAAFVSLAWSPDGLLAAATWGGNLLVLDSRTGEERARTVAHQGSVFGLAFTRDGKTMVTAGHDQLIRLWTMPDLTPVGALHGHRDEIWSLAFSHDGRLLCTAGKDGTAKVWSPEPRPPPPELTEWYEARFTADGRSFVTLSDPVSEFTLNFWDVENPGVRTLKTLPVDGVTNLVRAVLSGGAKRLGLGRKDGTLEVWDVEAGRLLRSGRLRQASLTSMAYSARGRWLALGTDQGTVHLWDQTTGQLSPLGSAGDGRVLRLEFTPGDHFLRAEVSGCRTEAVWDLERGKLLPVRIEPLGRSAFSPDGKVLATSETNYVIRLWDLPSLRERAELRGHRWTVYALTFSNDSQRLASGGLDAVACLWDVATGKELTPPLRGHLQGVTGVAFSPDGRSLATTSTDNTLKLWDVATGRELFTLPAATLAFFSEDGNTLLLKNGTSARLLHVPTLAEVDALRHTGTTPSD